MLVPKDVPMIDFARELLSETYDDLYYKMFPTSTRLDDPGDAVNRWRQGRTNLEASLTATSGKF